MLERFVLIETFKWTSTDLVLPMNLTVSDYVNNVPKFKRQYVLPQALLDASQLIRQKLNNFMLMRADMEIDVKVNANPFQQGALLAAYFPRALSTSKFRDVGTEFMASVTSTPHRTLFLEEGNSMAFRVPYANIYDNIDLTATSDSFGTLNLYVLAPLDGGTSNESVDVTVRLRFVDIQLEVPTDNSIMTQEKYREMERAFYASKTQSRTIHGLRAQMTEGEKQGPVSRISGAISVIGDTLSGIPFIGAAAKQISWVSRMVGSAASIFGWSKPLDLTMPRAILNRPAAYMGNTEGPDSSYMLASIADNAIDTSTMTPANLDEMALGYIFGRPNTVARITVPKSSMTAGKLLFSWEAAPASYFTQQRDSNGQDFCFGSFSFAACLFKLWRGSLEYTLSAVKTQYHSARIMAVYFPNRTRDEIPENYGELMTTNSNFIYDLNATDGSEFSMAQPIVVPYTSNMPWKNTLAKNAQGLYDQSSLKTCVGTIGVYCINELVCPDTVAQQVTFLLQVKAGHDFEVAVPQIQLQAGFAPTVPSNFLADFVSLLNNTFLLTQGITSTTAGQNPDIYDDNTGTSIRQSDPQVGGADWIKTLGETLNVPDGNYSASVSVVFSNSKLPSGNMDFTVSVLDGQISKCTTPYFGALADISDTETTYISFLSGFRAQMEDGAVEVPPTQDLLVNAHSSHDVSRGTTGEYVRSLRALIKRFVLTRLVTSDVALTPADFVNYDSTSVSSQLIGTRGWSSSTGEGDFVPESWLSLVSYLYRFCAGSVRSKIFINRGVEAVSSLNLSETLTTEFDTIQQDPAFVQHGNINNAVETTIPYYGQLRARVVGDQPNGLTAKQRFEASAPGPWKYYEAAGDDFSFWFLIGPPVMRPYDVGPIIPPVIQPASATT